MAGEKPPFARSAAGLRASCQAVVIGGQLLLAHRPDAQRVFSMYGGTPARITLLCDMRLLDVMIERFGLKSAVFQKVDDAHFSVSTKVEVSEQFFGWLTGFGTKVKLADDSRMEDGTSVAEEFKRYLGEIMEQYEEVSRL